MLVDIDASMEMMDSAAALPTFPHSLGQPCWVAHNTHKPMMKSIGCGYFETT